MGTLLRHKIMRDTKEYDHQRYETNKEQILARNKKWRDAHRGERLAYMREYRKINGEKLKELYRAYYRKQRIEAPWMNHYYGATKRCTISSHKDYKYYGGKGIRMLLTKEEVEILYKRDGAGDMVKPSIDRINPNGDYHFGNCRFIEHSENISRRFRKV